MAPKTYRLNTSGNWSEVKKWYRLSTSGTWQTIKKIYRLSISGNWSLIFTSSISPTITSPVQISSSTNGTTGLVTLTGTHYKWNDSTSLLYHFDVSSDGGTTWNSISSGSITNPTISDTVTYLVTQSNVTANVDNLYRFRVVATNSTYSTNTTSTSSTNVTINATRDITSISASANSSSSITVSWTGGTYTGSFKLEYKKSSDTNYTTFDHYDYNSSGNTATITGLTASTTYNFSITPYTGTRINSTSSKGYYGNFSGTSATTDAPPPVAPGDITNEFGELFPTLTASSNIANITLIQNYGSSYYMFVDTSTEDFLTKDRAIIKISGATGIQALLNNVNFRTVRASNRSGFYIYSPEGGFANISTQNYSGSSCQVTYMNRNSPYTAVVTWTPGSNTTKYVLNISMSDSSTSQTQTVTINDSTTPQTSYSFSSVGGVSITKNKYISVSVTPYNGVTIGNQKLITQLGVLSSDGLENITFNTKKPTKSAEASFVSVSGAGTATSPWQGDLYNLDPGTWTFHGDGLASQGVSLRDWTSGSNDYLSFIGYANLRASANNYDISPYSSYQIPSNIYGNQLILDSITANSSVLDDATDLGKGTYSTATTGVVKRLLPPLTLLETTASKTSSSLTFQIYKNEPDPPYWSYVLYQYKPAIVGTNGSYRFEIAQRTSFPYSSITGTLNNSYVVPPLVNSDPEIYTATPIEPATWYTFIVQGYNNGVYSNGAQNVLTYSKSTGTASLASSVINDFYIEKSGSSIAWWKIADNYSNTHLIYIEMQNTSNNTIHYFGGYYPFIFTATTDIPNRTSNPPASVKYTSTQTLPNGTYRAYLSLYNYESGFSTRTEFTNRIGTYPFVYP